MTHANYARFMNINTTPDEQLRIDQLLEKRLREQLMAEGEAISYENALIAAETIAWLKYPAQPHSSAGAAPKG